MNLSSTRVLGLIAIVAAVALSAYWIGNRQSQPAETGAIADSQPPAEEEPAEPLRRAPTNGTFPDRHPDISGDGMPVVAGDVQTDSNAAYTHYRVGERNVKKIITDGDLVWVGTSGGVIRYDTTRDSYRLFDTRSGLLANGVFHLSKLGGKLAVGTYGGGLSVMNEDDSWSTYNIPQGLADAFVYDLLELDNGDIWIATWSGANLVRDGELDNPDKWETYTVANTDGGLPNDWVYGLAKGKNGEIWMATEGGLARFQNERWDNWTHEDGQGAPFEEVEDQIRFKNDPADVSKHHARQKQEMGLQNVSIAYNPNYIVALLVDLDGSVWAGTWGAGLAHFVDGNFVNYTMDNGLPGNHVFMLYQDSEGLLWVGTSDGLVRREKDGQFTTFTTADGLYSNIVFAMARSSDEDFWIGSFGGVARVKALP